MASSQEKDSASDIEETMEVIDPDDDEQAIDVDEGETQNRVYLPGEGMAEDEQLVQDESAYRMYHQAQTGRLVLPVEFGTP